MALDRRVLGFILSLLMVATFSVGASSATVELDCRKAVDAFLALPTDLSLAALSRSDQAGCWSVVKSSNTNLDQLNHWVERGNGWAAQYVAKHLKQLDGGNLEDALTALGRFSDHDMERLLFFANKGLISKRELEDSLTMLPLSLSDDPRAQVHLLSARKSKVMRVTRKDLLEQRTQALSAINNFASEIRSKNPGE
jgi:hypothetical protein